MSTKIEGSELTRAMLEDGHEEVWCAVDDSCDQDTMVNLANNDFTAYIVFYENGMFYCTAGMAWACAVPIKIVAMTASDAKMRPSTNIS
ncbi:MULTISPECIES: hypothetical protein [unclassified Psychrobacter]|uniref:hypothetical protein n=1 Tax=unclassified Psychrobacter TaxID=196806 RepID=UPI0025EDFAF7|nr:MULTISPECIES: hypothetical protein [unclassified Psychrobacter]